MEPNDAKTDPKEQEPMKEMPYTSKPKAPRTCRAKFCVTGKQDHENGVAISLSAVYDPNPDSENGKFFKYTPAGSISLQIVNPAAAEVFKLNQEVYVDFTPVG